MNDSGDQAFATFTAFYRFYLGEHRNRTSRALHYVGTVSALAVLAWGLFAGPWWWLALAPVVGYGPAWIGHALFERNRPATFRHPLWSLIGDFRMLGEALSGRLAIPPAGGAGAGSGSAGT